MVDQRIVLLDPLEMCVPCPTVLWVLLVEGTSPMVLVHAHRCLHNPQCAKQLLEQQQANAAELKRLQSELASSSSKVAKKQRAPDPEFRFAGSKKQYELNMRRHGENRRGSQIG